MVFDMDDKEIFQPHYSNLKALVSVCGRDLKKEPHLLSKLNLDEQQIRRLSEILDNKKHPWMIDYYTRASFVETNPETSQVKGPREIILITIAVIFTCSLLIGIYTALRDEFDVTMIDYAKFILGLGTYLGVVLLIRKLPNFFLDYNIYWLCDPHHRVSRSRFFHNHCSSSNSLGTRRLAAVSFYLSFSLP